MLTGFNLLIKLLDALELRGVVPKVSGLCCGWFAHWLEADVSALIVGDLFLATPSTPSLPWILGPSAASSSPSFATTL